MSVVTTKKDSPKIKRIKDKKVFFVRINEDTYKEIGAIADKNERSINWTVNSLLKKALENNRSK